MIRPGPRLVFWVGVVGIPSTALAGLLPALAPASGLALVGLALLVLIDGAAARRRLHGIAVELPDLVRLGKDREGVLTVTVCREHPETTGAMTIRAAVALPAPFRGENECTARLPEAASKASVTIPLLSTHRGSYRIELAALETASPLGFWRVSRRCETSCELRVYPNLLAERRQLSALFLNRGGLGIHAHRQVGQGREFEKLREYQPGDAVEDIHWKASAKRGYPVSKQYQIERTQEVYVVIDASRMSGRDVPTPTPGDAGSERVINVLEYYLRAALVLGLVAERQGDLFGLVTFSDRVHQFVRARNGKAHFDSCRDALYCLQPRRVNPDFEELFSFLRTRLRRRALLLFLTSLDDPLLAEGFGKHIHILRRQHIVLASMFRPVGAHPLFTQPTVRSWADLHGALAGHMLADGLDELRLVLRRQGVGFRLLDGESMCADLVTDYVTVKRRQLL